MRKMFNLRKSLIALAISVLGGVLSPHPLTLSKV